MPKFLVEMDFEGSAKIQIEAKDRVEARNKAMAMTNAKIEATQEDIEGDAILYQHGLSVSGVERLSE